MKTESIRVSSRLIVMMLMIIVVSLAVYFNTLFNGFVFDDMFQILRNPWITDIRSISKIFSANVWTFAGLESNYYRPLMHIFYMGSYYVFGLEPWGFHLMNMLFHAGISTLVFLVISQLFQGFLNPASKYYLYAPFVAGMLFATHPIHTEVVAPIMGITDLSFTFFYLLSFYLYIRSGEGLSWGYLFSVISFLTSTLCKEPALTLPLILLAYDYAFQRWPPSILSFVQRYAAYLIAAGGYFSLRYFALGGVTALKENVGLTFIQYVLNTLYLFALYLKKLFLPVDLNFLFVFEPITSVADRRGILSLAIVLAFVAFCCVAIKKNRIVFLGLLLITLPLLPALYLPGLAQRLDHAFAERYLYLSSFGFVLLLALVARRVEVYKSKGGILALAMSFLVLVSLYSIETVFRNPIWKDSYSLWMDTAKKSPGSGVARQYLGYALFERGRIDEAIEQYQSAQTLKGDNVFIHYNLGVAYAHKGWLDRAIQEYQMTLDLAPNHAKARNNLGVAYDSKGFQDQAIEEYRMAIALKPDWADPHNNLGVAYAKKGLLDKAIENFEAAVRLKPNEPRFRENLAKANDAKFR